MKHKHMKEFTLKDQIKLKFLSDKFNVLMVFLLQESGNSNTLDELGDMAAQTAINENPHVTDLDQLVEAASGWIRMQLGIK